MFLLVFFAQNVRIALIKTVDNKAIVTKNMTVSTLVLEYLNPMIKSSPDAKCTSLT